MSMHEALSAIKKRFDGALPWRTEPEEIEEQLPPPTPMDGARHLVSLAAGTGHIDVTSGTWMAVRKWAAEGIISAQQELELRAGDRAAELRAECVIYRRILALEQGPVDTQRIEPLREYLP